MSRREGYWTGRGDRTLCVVCNERRAERVICNPCRNYDGDFDRILIRRAISEEARHADIPTATLDRGTVDTGGTDEGVDA